ncbi:hypothetical protein Tco_1319116 [Tanacetum coccineum]
MSSTLSKALDIRKGLIVHRPALGACFNPTKLSLEVDIKHAVSRPSDRLENTGMLRWVTKIPNCFQARMEQMILQNQYPLPGITFSNKSCLLRITSLDSLVCRTDDVHPDMLRSMQISHCLIMSSCLTILTVSEANIHISGSVQSGVLFEWPWNNILSWGTGSELSINLSFCLEERGLKRYFSTGHSVVVVAELPVASASAKMIMEALEL